MSKLTKLILEHLSIICREITLKLYKDDLVIRLDVKDFNIQPYNDGWKLRFNVLGMYYIIFLIIITHY